MDNMNETESAAGTQSQDISPANQTDRDLLLLILSELRLLSDQISAATAFQKPILTMDEAARLLGMSKKRLESIIYEEKVRIGRLPDFVCDAGGMIRRHILRDKFIEWVTKRRTRRGRPSKITLP